ncbi:MAG: flagellar hook-basal body complex protein [bacterium]
MLRSLFTGVSGLRNHQTELDVVSNNIANINTLGFKSGRVTFKEAFSQTIRGAGRPSSTIGGTNPQQIGLGMSVGSIDQLFTQGQFESTGVATDVAIEGDGFFVLSDGNGQFYSRVGTFRFDGDGRLVSSDGHAVQGIPADANGAINSAGAVGDIVVPVGLRSEATATTEVILTGNLDASRNPVSAVAETRPVLAGALASDNLAGLRNASGVSLGLADGQTITFLANATAVTRIGELHTEDGDAISLGGATTITISDGTTTTQITSLTEQSSLEELRAAIEGALTSVSVGITSDGALMFTNSNATPLSISVSVGSTSPFNEMVREVAIAAGGTNFSARLDARTEIALGSDAGEAATAEALAVRLQAAFREVAGAAATVDFGTAAAGRFTFTGGGTTVTGVSVAQSGGGTLFGSSLALPSGSFGPADTVASSLLLDTASREDALTNLYSETGVSLGIATSDTLTFAASRGAESLSPVAITVGADGATNDAGALTYGGLVDEMSAALAFTSGGSVAIGDDGGLVVNSDPGGTAALSTISLSETDNAALAATLGFVNTREASDVTASGSITVFDGLGNTHVVSLTFTKDPSTPNQWSWNANVAEPRVLVSGGTGTATFGTDGTLVSFASSDGLPLAFDPANGATNPVSITIDAGAEGALAGLTQFAAPSEVLIAGQNGYASGVLDSINIDDDGVVNALFTNGTQRSVAQIVLARFVNPSGLSRLRDNAYAASSNSGLALVVAPGSSGGKITSGVIEMSNVDLAREFTSLIIAQRGFQANARSITTSDEMLSELVNLKR